MTADLPKPTPGAKMMYLIRRRPEVSRDELIVHWFANHMPEVIAAQARAASRGRPRARRYLAALFQPDGQRPPPWDGVAQLWWDRPLPSPAGPFGVPPRDSFQERAEPYESWATVEYVIVDGAAHLPVSPLRFGAPFPTTRSGFHKITWLVAARPGSDHEAFFRHWLTVHADRVRRVLPECGGFRYVVSLSLEPDRAPYAGMAELYFHDAEGWLRLGERLPDDGIERWVDAERTFPCPGDTEMIGIP